MIKTKTQLEAENDANITTNGSGDITGAILNALFTNLIDSLQSVIQSYTRDARNLLTPTALDIIYNSTDKRFEWYTGASWRALGLLTGQSVAPTTTLTGTTLNDGAGSGASFTITTGALDERGSFTIVAGNGTPTAGKAGTVVFNIPKEAAPKCVICFFRDSDGLNNQIYVPSSGVATTGFEVWFGTALAASEAVEFYYLVIE